MAIQTIDDDIFSPEVMTDPYPYFGRLRDEDPIHWNEKYDIWIITRYDHLVWIARHHELFSSMQHKLDPRPPYPPIQEDDMGLYHYVTDFFSDWFALRDRPTHTDMRRVVHHYFTPKETERWRPLVRSAINYLLDEVEEDGRMDMMRDFATPLPVLVIAQMLGLPTGDRLFIRDLAEKLTFIGRGESSRMKPLAEGIKGLIGYVEPLMEDRVDSPKDDLMSILAGGVKAGAYSREEALANSLLLLMAGHETTINLICNGALSFMRYSDQWELLRSDPSGMTVRATEECLRYDPPVKSIGRIASEDVELGDRTVGKHDRMRWYIASANRDPEIFDEPDRFDITRHPNRHVAFGSGIHHCLGATLARLEGQEAFMALAERFPAMRLESEELEYHPTNSFRSLKSLPVSWS